MKILSLFEQQIGAYRGSTIEMLSNFEPTTAIYGWLEIVRGIEEIINIPGADRSVLTAEFLATPLKSIVENLVLLYRAQVKVESRFERATGQRFIRTILYAASLQKQLLENGNAHAARTLITVHDSISFFQSRRRHMVTVLQLLPSVCRGKKRFSANDDAIAFLQAVENEVAITGFRHKAMLATVFSDYKLIKEEDGLRGNYEYQPLDDLFLEPERTSLTDLKNTDPGSEEAFTKEALDRRKIFSAAEVRNNILYIKNAYKEFDLSETNFGIVANIFEKLLEHCNDDFIVTISPEQMRAATAEFKSPEEFQKLLIHSRAECTDNVDDFPPFVDANGAYITTINLMQRFLYNYKNTCLNKNKRYQVRSGFIFENKVKRELAKQGFTISDIKRIHHKEFDVIALKDGIIYNLQCKNNLVDLTRIDCNLKLFVRYNSQLVRYYQRALAKEEGRVELLGEKFGFTKVRHFVISGFSVATSNQNIVSFAQLGKFSTLVQNLED
ncbi:hypothetical protein [Undibacterium pigrum]|uniref:Restriction endonuclease n=1 Tax=Undibacterium pigrum TaxID=401470 RepID=A0A318JBM0_9BURK|nr:hypothetical protein [Undibacterium pigrum]PXX46968.1 hypothetical protein DFR42_101544 [Undibacterium pigrum]